MPEYDFRPGESFKQYRERHRTEEERAKIGTLDDDGLVITTYHKDGRTVISSVGGVDWMDAPIPPRWHRCQLQTRGWIDYFTLVDRCACGAIRLSPSRIWTERNARRRRR